MSNNEDVDPRVHPAADICYGVILCCIMVVAIVGNTLTFVVVAKMRNWKSSAIIYVTHLAIVDIIMNILITPFSASLLFKGRLDNAYTTQDASKVLVMVCEVSGFAYVLVRALTPLTNVNIAIDRTIAVTLPLNYNRIMNVWSNFALLLANWIVAVAFASATIIINHFVADTPQETYYKYNDYITVCSVNIDSDVHYRTFLSSLTVSTVIIPFFVVLILSMVVIKELGRRTREDKKTIKNVSSSDDVRNVKRSLRTRKATRTLLMVVYMYLFLWLPYCVLWFLDTTGFMNDGKINPTTQLHLATIATLCISLNSATNPLLFITRSDKYRDVIRQSFGNVREKIITYREELSQNFSGVRDANGRKTTRSQAKDSSVASVPERDLNSQRTETFL